MKTNPEQSTLTCSETTFKLMNLLADVTTTEELRKNGAFRPVSSMISQAVTKMEKNEIISLDEVVLLMFYFDTLDRLVASCDTEDVTTLKKLTEILAPWLKKLPFNPNYKQAIQSLNKFNDDIITAKRLQVYLRLHYYRAVTFFQQKYTQITAKLARKEELTEHETSFLKTAETINNDPEALFKRTIEIPAHKEEKVIKIQEPDPDATDSPNAEQLQNSAPDATIRHALILSLDNYIKQIESHTKTEGKKHSITIKNADGEKNINFAHGFHGLAIFRKARADNRALNYLLAKQLRSELEKGQPIDRVFENIGDKRNEIAKEKNIGSKTYIGSGVRSETLNRIIKEAHDYCEKHPANKPTGPA